MSALWGYICEAVDGIWRNKARSMLSVLGMVIGIASVTGVLGLSQAATNGMKSMIASGGDPGYIVAADQSADDPTLATLYYRDVSLLQAYAGGTISRAVPLYGVFGAHQYRVDNGGHRNYVVLHSADGVGSSSGIDIVSGRVLTPQDVSSAANVGMLSKSAADKIFPSGNAVGQTINLGTQRITIVGVYTFTGSLFNGISGDVVDVPYTTVHNIQPGPIDAIQFWVAPGVSAATAVAAVRSSLARIHPRAQFTIQDQSEELGVFVTLLSVIAIGLTFIGGIALLVAGVGIMNIMLVSVTERTREIGIRKSIGASRRAIAVQFVVEAFVLSLAGGVVGSAIGVAVVEAGVAVIRQALGEAPVPWLLVISIAAGFSTIVGLGFGFYPAFRAAKLDPVQALRS